MDKVPGDRFPIPRAWKKSIAKEVRQRAHASLARLSAGPIALQVEGFEGVFEIGPSSDLFLRIWFDGDYEPELRALLLKHLDPRRDAIDVGANIGLFAILLARHARHVLAVEPTPAAHQLLLRNIGRNEVSETVTPEQKALMATPGSVTMQTMAGREEYSTTGVLKHEATVGEAHQQIEVEAVTLDAMVDAHQLDPGIIKIDVEGGETSVLKGALKTLDKHRPVVIAECSPRMMKACGSSPGELIGLLRDHGYRVTDPDGGAPGEREYGDILAVPE